MTVCVLDKLCVYSDVGFTFWYYLLCEALLVAILGWDFVTVFFELENFSSTPKNGVRCVSSILKREVNNRKPNDPFRDWPIGENGDDAELRHCRVNSLGNY